MFSTLLLRLRSTYYFPAFQKISCNGRERERERKNKREVHKARLRERESERAKSLLHLKTRLYGAPFLHSTSLSFSDTVKHSLSFSTYAYTTHFCLSLRRNYFLSKAYTFDLSLSLYLTSIHKYSLSKVNTHVISLSEAYYVSLSHTHTHLLWLLGVHMWSPSLSEAYYVSHTHLLSLKSIYI